MRSGWDLLKDILSPPAFVLDINELLDVFGFFMLVLIGLELLDTIKAYFEEHAVHSEIVIEVALIAIARKIIILDAKNIPSATLLGIAAIVVALAVAYFAIKRGRLPGKASAGEADRSTGHVTTAG